MVDDFVASLPTNRSEHCEVRDPIGVRMNQDGTNDSGLGEAEAEWLVAMGDPPTPMTLDELDEAFRDGLIHEGTLVWAQGMPAWIPLGELASAPDDGTHLEPLLGREPEQSAQPMDDHMPKEDPRLWNLSSDDARAARRFDMKVAAALEEEETELGAEDLDEDVTPCGIPPRVVASAEFTPGIGATSVPPRTTSSTSPTMPPRSAPPRVSTLPRVPPPPRTRSLPPAAKGFESLPPIAPAVFESLPPIANITAFESTAPFVRTLSEPVIPIQAPPPGWNWRPWAAAAGMVFGLGAYGLSVLDLASSSPQASQRPAAAVAAAEVLPEPQAEAVSAAVPRQADITNVASDVPVTAAVMPLASQAAADDASGLALEPEPSKPTSASRKGKKKKAGAKSWKKKKLAKAKTKTKAPRPARSRPAAAAAAYKFLGMK